MIKLSISYGDVDLETWETVQQSNFLLADSVRSVYTIENIDFKLPNDEAFVLSATYSASNGGLQIVVNQDDVLILSITSYRKSSELTDPAIVFLSPNGVHVSIMVSE